ncbi:LuxR C-terminal-related transcriptional regulator [Streptomyces sp. NPDC050145]|uniref:LuxR C-terminal-related transcriptional regulator n=1 Tax=Streptomyces sp. NPDC050145 TaxID=3365602 RepID=UPI00379789E8
MEDVVRARAREIYRAALDAADWHPEALVEARGWNGTEFAEALQLLGELGLFTPSSDTRSGWTALSPDTALRNLLLEEDRSTGAYLDAMRQTRAALDRLVVDFHPLRVRGLLDAQLEVVTGAANVSAALEDASQRVEDEVLSLHPGRALPTEMIEAGLERDRLALGRGVRIRTIHLGAVAAVPHMTSYLRRLNAEGAQVRTAHTLPLRLIVLDRSSAIVPAPRPADGNDEEIAALVLRGETLVGVFREIFEHCWASASLLADAHDEPDRPDDGSGWLPSGRHRELLRMLAGGLTDEAMARKLGLSERTVRRLVAELSERLGAASRFQAGVCAVRSGWLDD